MLAANQPWRSQAKGSVDIAGGLGISATGRRPQSAASRGPGLARPLAAQKGATVYPSRAIRNPLLQMRV